MSKRGSKINSPLFMTDPVPIRKGKATGFNREGSTFIKGETNTTFERKPGTTDEIYIVKSPAGTFNLDRMVFKDMLNELKTFSQVQIKLLKKDQMESFNTIGEALRLLYGSGKLYEMVHNDIQEIYSDIKHVIPGTLGAFFIGCSSSDNFTGPMGCNPKCAASLRPGEKTTGYSACEDLVLIYHDGEFNALNQIESNSPHVWVYVGDNFKGFTTENIEQLKEAEITHVTLTYGQPDSSDYKEIVNRIPVDLLPKKLEMVAQTPATATTTENTGAGIVFFIIIVIIIIVLLLVLYNASQR